MPSNLWVTAVEVKRKVTEGKRLNILGSKQLLQKLPIVLTQVKANNASENLRNEFRKIIYFLYWAKETIKKLYNGLLSFIKL